MGRKNVPVKTAEGAQEIKTRALGLAPRIRTALLLVDGVKSAVELEHLMTAAGVTPGALQLLLDKGLIRFPEDEQSSVPEPAAMIAETETFPATVVETPGPQFADTELLSPPVLSEPAAAPGLAASHAIADPVLPSSLEKNTSIDQSEEKTEQSQVTTPALQHNAEMPMVSSIAPSQPAPTSAALEVVTLLELETILNAATNVEMETILGVTTMLELTPTQVLAPDTVIEPPAPVATAPVVKVPIIKAPVVKAPPSEPVRLLPPVQVQNNDNAAKAVLKPVKPAAVLRMNLLVARAHLASVLDQFLEIDGYVLKQKVIVCEVRAELEQLFRLIEGALVQKMDKATVARHIGTAQAILDR